MVSLERHASGGLENFYTLIFQSQHTYECVFIKGAHCPLTLPQTPLFPTITPSVSALIMAPTRPLWVLWSMTHAYQVLITSGDEAPREVLGKSFPSAVLGNCETPPGYKGPNSYSSEMHWGCHTNHPSSG